MQLINQPTSSGASLPCFTWSSGEGDEMDEKRADDSERSMSTTIRRYVCISKARMIPHLFIAIIINIIAISQNCLIDLTLTPIVIAPTGVHPSLHSLERHPTCHILVQTCTARNSHKQAYLSTHETHLHAPVLSPPAELPARTGNRENALHNSESLTSLQACPTILPRRRSRSRGSCQSESGTCDNKT